MGVRRKGRVRWERDSNGNKLSRTWLILAIVKSFQVLSLGDRDGELVLQRCGEDFSLG